MYTVEILSNGTATWSTFKVCNSMVEADALMLKLWRARIDSRLGLSQDPRNAYQDGK